MARRQPERAEQAHIARLIQSIGGRVRTLGTTRRRADQHHGTMMSPGLPDMICFLPGAEPWMKQELIIEVKAKGGRLRPEQAEFREDCLAAGIAHVVGGLDSVIGWLLAHGYLSESSVAHYRVPKPREA